MDMPVGRPPLGEQPCPGHQNDGLGYLWQKNPQLGIGIETYAAGIGIPAPGISVRYHSIPELDWVLLIQYLTAPGIGIFIHSGTGLTRSKRMDQMPYSPAHFAAIEEPISCGFFAWPVFANFLHIQFPDFYQQNIDDFRINSVRSSV
jgi:hypothetical protein